MKYLNKIQDKKRAVGTRVSEDVLTALAFASKDVEFYKYEFSIGKVIEKALKNTLEEIKEITKIDYYKLAKLEKKVESIFDEIDEIGAEFINDIITFEPSQYVKELKEEYRRHIEYGGEKDLDTYIKDWEKDFGISCNKKLKPHKLEMLIEVDRFRFVGIGRDGKRKNIFEKEE